MIYEWRCAECKEVTEIERVADDYEMPPDDPCHGCGCGDWTRKLSVPSTPWESLWDSGQFYRAVDKSRNKF